MRPLVFSSSRDVKAGIDELIKAELVTAEYSNGNISNIKATDKLFDVIEQDSTITVVKEKKKSKDTPSVDPAVIAIVKHYNSYDVLPRPSTMTPLAIKRITEKLELYGEDVVMDAITYASTQNWVINKGSEPWMNMSWIMQNLDGFVSGGKYRRNSSQVQDSSTNKYAKYGIDEDDEYYF